MSYSSAPASTTEAMDMVLTGLRHLAAADPTTLAAQAQADCLQAFEQAGAMATAARAWFLGAFTVKPGLQPRTPTTAPRRGSSTARK